MVSAMGPCKTIHSELLLEDNPAELKRLQDSGELEAHLSEVYALAEETLGTLAEGVEKMPNGAVRRPINRVRLHEQVIDELRSLARP